MGVGLLFLLVGLVLCIISTNRVRRRDGDPQLEGCRCRCRAEGVYHGVGLGSTLVWGIACVFWFVMFVLVLFQLFF